MSAFRLGVVMDPLHTIQYAKDSTLAMLWEASARDWEIVAFELKDLLLHNGKPFGVGRPLTVSQQENWFEAGQCELMPLEQFDILLMRKDPPVDQAYWHATYILEHAQRLGVNVANHPLALRQFNEKQYTTLFPDCVPPTLITQSRESVQMFCQEYGEVVCKPLDGMGGVSVFRLQKNDVNLNVVFDTLTNKQSQYMIVQQYLPEIVKGDKRILLVNGEPVPHVLARVPQPGDWRGNMAVGAKPVIQPLTERDQYICAQVGPSLRKHGITFAGIDVIGDYLTEINITSPTGIREIDAQAGTNVSAMLLDCLIS